MTFNSWGLITCSLYYCWKKFKTKQ